METKFLKTEFLMVTSLFWSEKMVPLWNTVPVSVTSSIVIVDSISWMRVKDLSSISSSPSFLPSKPILKSEMEIV